MGLSVTVDRARCQATGYCVKLAPALFRLEGDGPSRFEPERPDAVDLDSLYEAEDTCPTRAIKVEHDRV